MFNDCAMALGARIRYYREKAGLTLDALSDRSGVDIGTISALENRDSSRSKYATAIAQGLGLSLEKLEDETRDYDLSASPSLDASTSAEQTNPDAVRVPVLANAGSMGPGEALMDGDVIVGDLLLSQNWVRKEVRPSSIGALRFIHAYGDSMAPTFQDGDVLLVDTGTREAAIDGVYVLEAHERIFIKRVRQRLDGQFEVSSDNPTVKTLDILNGDHPVGILGRVLWAWNGKKL